MATRILILESEPAQRRILQDMVGRFGLDPVLAETGGKGLEILTAPQGASIELILLDLNMPGMDGHEFLARLPAIRPALPVIVQAAPGAPEAVTRAMHAGADDFIVKPASPERLKVSIENLLKVSALTEEVRRLKRKVAGELTFAQLIGSGPGMAHTVRIGRRAAQTGIPVLIEGETGVGKEMVARAIHGESPRAGKPFVSANVSRLQTDPAAEFRQADGGTLFLHEVDALSPGQQEMLLGLIEQGAVAGARVDIRLICATSRDMIALVKEGLFREDLYYRLNVFPVPVPALRDRREDIGPLTQHFITRFAAEEGRKLRGIDTQALEMLKGYGWPGNVRQLENTIFRATVLAEGDLLTIEDFPQIAALADGYEVRIPPAPRPAPKPALVSGHAAVIGTGTVPLRAPAGTVSDGAALGIPVVTDGGHVRRLEDVEADMIRLALNRYRGQMSEVARKLGIGRSTLYRKMRDLGLEARM